VPVIRVFRPTWKASPQSSPIQLPRLFPPRPRPLMVRNRTYLPDPPLTPAAFPARSSYLFC
jgi:hypothetical protein